MSDIISDLAKNGYINLIKILYEAGNYPDKYCIINAIDNNHYNILDWLISINYKMDENNLYYCIYKNKFVMFKKIFNYCKNIDKNCIFNYAILYNKFFFVRWMYMYNCNINIDSVICVLMSKNKFMIKWIFDILINENNDKFYILVNLVKANYSNDKYITHTINNYSLIKKVKKISNDDDIFFKINNFLTENNNTQYDIILQYDKYVYPILLASFLSKNMDTIFSVIEINKLICNLDNIIEDVVMYYNRKSLKITDKQIENFFISFELFNKVDSINLYSTFYRHIVFNKIRNKFYESGFLIKDKINFNLLINEPLVYETWDEVIDNNLIIYVDNMRYGYVISEILQHWKLNLNAYNYGIVPKYPTNPYTGQLINPVELYRIIIYAIKNNIKIPFIIRFFIKHPLIVLSSFNKFNQSQEHHNENNYYLRDLFLLNNLKCIGSIPELNEGGKWKLDYNDSYIFLYNILDISYEISILQFYFIYNNIF